MKSEIFAISYVVVTIATEKEEGGGKRKRKRVFIPRRKVRVAPAVQIAYSLFAAQFSSRVSNTIRYDLTLAAGRRGEHGESGCDAAEGNERGSGDAGGRKSLIYSVNGVIRTRRRPYLVYQPVGIMSF